MNSTVQTALDSVETTLQTLIESVSTYNPSQTHAQELVDADIQLEETLEQLDVHQQNQRKIQSLRDTTANLDQQLTDLLMSLAEVREHLISVPSTELPPANEVPYDSLLSYASKIAQYTRPANLAEFRKQPATIALLGGAAPAAPSQQPVQEPIPGDSQQQHGQKARRDLLSDEDKVMLDPSASMPFTPWPTEAQMKSGRIAGVVPLHELEMEEAKRREEAAKAVNGEAKKEEVNRRVSNAAPLQAPPQQKPALALDLDLYDPDEED